MHNCTIRTLQTSNSKKTFKTTPKRTSPHLKM